MEIKYCNGAPLAASCSDILRKQSGDPYLCLTYAYWNLQRSGGVDPMSEGKVAVGHTSYCRCHENEACEELEVSL